MSNSVEKHLLSNPASILGQWIDQTIGPQNWRVKFHLRGNNLHVLLQGTPCPERLLVLPKMIAALQKTDLNTLLPSTHPQIYQVQLYGAQLNQTHPDWTVLIYLNQLDRHWEQIQQEQTTSPLSAQTKEIGVATASSAQSSETATSVISTAASPPQQTAIALSNRSLARQGQETAIASYLSETLSDLGVAVRVSVKVISFAAASQVYTTDTATPASATKRLWIACEAAYSPDPSLIGEPISQKLRDLEIEGYRDAVILFQVAGESRPDWMLRVDLTPPEAMLREWARWGDLEAIQTLLNRTVAHLGVKFSTASLKEQTLHLVCGVMTALAADAGKYPDRAALKAEVLPLLETLAPQGIHAATVYGQFYGQSSGQPTPQAAPAWVEWLELPASLHPALSDSALTLAQQGDWEAIAFLLHRLLNPDLENYLTTGGIRLQLLPKQDLLHIMTEAVVCPDQRQVGYQIARFLKPLNLPEITGVRVYGRRSGQRYPIWSYGVDFASRGRIVPEATPDFAATDAYVGDLIAKPEEPVVLPDLTAADWQTAWKELRQRTTHHVQQWLVRSQLFLPDANSEATSLAVPYQVAQQGFKLVAVWGAVGVLLTVQLNWLLGNSLRLSARSAKSTPAIAQGASPLPATVISSTAPVSTEEPSDFSLPEVDLPQSSDADTNAFAQDGFTAPPEATPSAASPEPAPAAPANLPYTSQDAATNLKLAETLASDPAIPDFNSRQMNDKLKLYYRLLKESGPPDILIVGSSRALRGVDPTQLEKELAEMGYGEVKIFNFGVNGATAQVVDLLLRRLLTADQLPRLVVWADGARAFNSNGTDVTFNGIAVSPAYQQLVQGTLALPTIATSEANSAASNSNAAKPAEGINLSLSDSYQALDRWLSQQLAHASKTYSQRDRLKHLIQNSLTDWLPAAASSPDAIPPDGLVAPQDALNLPRDYELVDAKGFLSLAIQFNPATYYQKYAKVPGAYDRDYADFQIPGAQETALRTLLQYTQTQQVPIVFVNLPMTNEYLDPARMNYEQQFRDYMVNLSMQQPGFTFRDLGELWTTNHDYFSDPSHLNRYGAYAISHQLAQDPLIPWIKPEAEQP